MRPARSRCYHRASRKAAIKEFEIPRDATADGKLEITFRRPTDEADLNWRQQSRASEAWLEVDDEK